MDGPYTDTTPGIDVKPDVAVGIRALHEMKDPFNQFIESAKGSFRDITSNWTAGEKHEEAVEAFEKFNRDIEDKCKVYIDAAFQNVLNAYDRIYPGRGF